MFLIASSGFYSKLVRLKAIFCNSRKRIHIRFLFQIGSIKRIVITIDGWEESKFLFQIGSIKRPITKS